MGSCVFLRLHLDLVRGTCIHHQPKLLYHSTFSRSPRPQPSHLRRYPSRRRALQDHLGSLAPEITWRRKQACRPAPHLHDHAPRWRSAGSIQIILVASSPFSFFLFLLSCTLVVQLSYQSFFHRAIAHSIHSPVSTDPFHSFQASLISPGRLWFQSRIHLTSSINPILHFPSIYTSISISITKT